MIKITPELLEKYELGMCSQEEQDAVESWLAGTHDEFSTLAEQTLEKMESNIWGGLASELSEVKTPVFTLKKMIRYAGVACVVAIIVSIGGYTFLCNTGWMNAKVVVDNTNGSDTKNIQAVSLEFSVLPKSKILATAKFCNGTVNVDYCGNYKIQNTSGKKVRLNINSQCSSDNIIANVILKPKDNCALYTGLKGKNYLIKNNNPYSLSPADWQRYRSLFLS